MNDPATDAAPPAFPSAAAYLDVVRDTIERVATTQSAAVDVAADLMTTAIRRGGVIHAFGTGHSQSTAMEIAGRAGGLIPTSRISLLDLVTLGGEPVDVLADPLLERDPELAQRLYAASPIEPDDVFVIASNSGINGSVVSLALLVRERGHKVIAITSLEHSARVPSRHPSGAKLADAADVVLDNGGPFGDAVLPLPAGGAVCAVSTITSALLAQLLTAEVTRRLLDAGDTPPVYLSVNVPEGDAHNEALLDRYAGRIRRGG